MRNQNAVAALRQAADKLETRLEAIRSISTMENFWAAPIEWIKDGQLTREPFDPTAGIPYRSVAPIRVVPDNWPPYKDPIEPRMKQAFYRYSEIAVKNGAAMPTFNSYWDGIRFRLKNVLTRLRVI